MKKVRIKLGPVKSVLTPGKFPISKILELCSYKPSWARFSRKVQDGVWDGKIRLASLHKDGSIVFPTGLVDIVAAFLKDKGMLPVYKPLFPDLQLRRHLREKHAIRPLIGIDPRYYQTKATKIGLRKQRGIFKLPTGSGKTVVAAMLTKAIKTHTIFLTHKKDILSQTYESFQKMIGKEYVGLVGSGKKDWNYITCCMVQTLHRNWKTYRKEFERCGLLIVDEVHLATSPSWYNITMKIPAEFRFGLTATPLTDSRKILLQAATGPILYELKSQKLIDEGYLSKPHIFMVTVKRKQVEERCDYQDAYQQGVVEHEIRNKKIVSICKAISKIKRLTPIVIQTKKIEHLKRLDSMLSDTKLTYRVLWGKDSNTERRKVVKELEARSIDVLIVSTIFDEGVDVRNIRTLIVGSGGVSDEKTIQRLGRGMRTADGKSSMILIDFFDATHEYLEKHSKRRRFIYKREGYDVKVVSIKKLKSTIKNMKEREQ
jgi:superfamily II DNA or RNA helicase